MPFLILLFVMAWMDRVNVGFAKLQMVKDLSFSEAVYGFGAGIFFLGYLLFEIPSNLFLEKIGARKTIARITILWASPASRRCLLRPRLGSILSDSCSALPKQAFTQASYFI